MDEQKEMCCMDGAGCLPTCGPLANPYVPFQPEDAVIYEAPMALVRGTLFPGLDLPFMDLVNQEAKSTPLGELQALNFAMQELGLYLDTHQNDAEAAELFSEYAKLYEEGREAYEAKYGPLTRNAAVADGRWKWLNDPWPWEYEGGKQ